MQKLFTANVETPLGLMTAVADDTSLHLLEFSDWTGLYEAVTKLCKKADLPLVEATSTPLISIERELQAYFEGTLKTFTTPLTFAGSPFQQRVWQQLQKIPYGATISYRSLAASINNPAASRAVGTANGANLHVLIVPCHRVISSDGTLGGYSQGLHRKQWLLDHEKRHRKS